MAINKIAQTVDALPNAESGEWAWIKIVSNELMFNSDGTNTRTVVTKAQTQTLTNKTLTAPVLTAVTITGTSTIANGMTITTPVLSGSITGTYTLAGTPTLTSPTINTPTLKRLTEVVTTTNVIAAAETGSVFFLGSATGFVSTLPAVAAGLNFVFIVSTAPTSGSHTVIGASGTPTKGHVLTNDVNSATDSDFGTAGELTVTFVVNKAVAGDKAEFYCDGTNWFVSAACSVFDAITIS